MTAQAIVNMMMYIESNGFRLKADNCIHIIYP